MNDEQLADRAFEEASRCVEGLVRVKGDHVRRSIKCVLVPAQIGQAPVMIKAVFAKPALWRWYLAREAELYRAFAVGGVEHVPRLYAATDSLMVRSRFVGRVLAEKRHDVMDDDATWHGVEDLLRSVAGITIEPPRLGRDEASSQMMRRRLLEDPDAPAGWVVDGFDRAVTLGILTPRDATKLKAAVLSDEARSFAHGDLLLRNIVRLRDGGRLVLIDWECAGTYLRGWDAALVSVWAPEWFQDARVAEDGSARFAALRAWALVREINFRLKRPTGDATSQRLRTKLRDVIAALA